MEWIPRDADDKWVFEHSDHWQPCVCVCCSCISICMFFLVREDSCHFIRVIGDAIPVSWAMEYYVYLIFACVCRTKNHHRELCWNLLSKWMLRILLLDKSVGKFWSARTWNMLMSTAVKWQASRERKHKREHKREGEREKERERSSKWGIKERREF